MMRKYIVFEKIKVQHANAMPAFNLIGAPAITAHLGFARAIAYRYSSELNGVAILHHRCDFEGRYVFGRLSPNLPRGVPCPLNSSDKKITLSDQPSSLCHYEVSLLLEVEGEDLSELISHANDGKLFAWLTRSARFAGGVILSIKNISVVDIKLEAMRKMPKTGFWVLDGRHLVEGELSYKEDYSNSNEMNASCENGSQDLSPNLKRSPDVLDSIMSTLYPKETHPSAKKEKEKLEEKIKKKFLALSCVGYAPLTDFKHREGVRQNLPHAYCEPLLGVIEYKSKRLTTESENIFWSYAYPQTAIVAQIN